VYGFNTGFLMNAGEFDGTSDWGLSFTIWSEKNDKKNEFKLKVEKSNDLGEIEYLFDKGVYNLDGEKEASKWIREEIKGLKTFDLPNLTSAIISKDSGTVRGRTIANSLGYLLSQANNIYENLSGVSMLTSPSSKGHGLSITKQNYLKTSTLFTARKSIKPDWINQKDEYMAPNESHPLWQQFQHDSIVYSLFNTSSNQSSLRQIDYKGKKWDIKNEFFWISKQEMMDLAEKNFFDDVYRDARSSEERYVYKLLYKEGIYEKLSPDAKEVLDLATELVKLTFNFRTSLHSEHPEYHLNTWDAGWYQIKLLLKQFYPDKLKHFTKKYKELEDRMRPLVYELGFLRK